MCKRFLYLNSYKIISVIFVLLLALMLPSTSYGSTHAKPQSKASICCYKEKIIRWVTRLDPLEVFVRKVYSLEECSWITAPSNYQCWCKCIDVKDYWWFSLGTRLLVPEEFIDKKAKCQCKKIQ